MLKESGNNNETLIILKEALNAVEYSYLHQNYQQVSRRFQRPERVFVAELYHQLRAMQNQSLQGLSYHVEPTKMRSVSSNNPCFPVKPISRISPDIVLHRAQDDKKKENQLLVCEVKMKGVSYLNIEKDLRKLIFYKDNPLNFQNAVFICTENRERIEEFLEQVGRPFIKCLCKYKIVFALPIKKNKDFIDWEIFEPRCEKQLE